MLPRKQIRHKLKKISSVFFLLLLFLLSGCIIQIDSGESDRQTDIVLNAFKTGETEELEGLFCKKIADRYDLESEINKAIDFIDGKIINDGHRIGMGEAGSKYRDGVKVDSHIRPHIEDLKTDTNHYYMISFFSYLIYDGDPDCIGMTYLSVYETDKEGHLTENSYSYTVGEDIFYSPRQTE